MDSRQKASAWWATPILEVEAINCTEFNRELARLILQEESRRIGDDRSTALPVFGRE
jgi:hypothetical protein